MRPFLPVLEQARREVARDLLNSLRGTSSGQETYTTARYRATLAHLDHAFATVRASGDALGGGLESSVADAGQLAADHVVAELARFEHLFTGITRHVPIQASALISTGQQTLVQQVHSSADRYGPACVNDIKRELAVGVVRGESISQMTDRLLRIGGIRQRIAGDHIDAGGMIADGLFDRYRYWGERIARTETQRCYNSLVNDSLHQAAAHVPGLVKRWDASLDLRVCPDCAAMHGTTAPLNGTFPGGYDFPPMHPNCRCRVGAWRSDWAEILAETAEPE